ncbi:MAG: FtsQ-type POTRA domain-containing protein [Clostridia bacterium]|nr:FtsQ-type POTRA domain-containing protein [Clostridia bacterium]
MAQQFPQDFSSFQQAAPPPPTRKHSGIISVVAVLVLILAILVILNESLLKIHNIAVVGNQRVTWNEVIEAAGLKRTTGYFTVNEADIAAGIESNRYLIFERLEKHFPDSLTLYVRERVPRVYVSEMGAVYALDDEGMVLERKEQGQNGEDLFKTAANESMIVVTGLKPKDLRVGHVMTAGSTNHMNAYRELLTELKLQGFSGQVSELNITDPDSLYLVTTDGYTAHLGDLSNLRAKIGTVRAVVAKLREMEKKGGMLEASKPGEAIYTPANP